MNTTLFIDQLGTISISVETLLIILLFIYVIFLHYRLNKKNSLLKSYIEKIIKNESNLDKKDILKFLENLKNPEFSGIVTKDKLLNEKILKFLFENDSETKLFLHYTATEEVAQKILKEGFKFVNSFYKTAEFIFNDNLYLVHRHNEHKQFGHYVIAICISKKTYNHYTRELNKIDTKNIAVEQILTEVPSYTDENSEEIYTFPKQFIKGYFNYIDGSIKKNPDFDYNYKSDIFDENLKLLHSSK